MSIPERWLVMVLMQELTSAHYDGVTELLTNSIVEDLTASGGPGSYSSERERDRESSSQHHSPVNTEL